MTAEPFARLTQPVLPVTSDGPESLEVAVRRLEAKLDAIGRQQTYITNHAAMLFAGILNSPMGAMIRKALPAEVLEQLSGNA